MRSSEFIKKWGKERKIGIYLYSLKCTIYIILGSHIGAILGYYMAKRVLFINPFCSFEYYIGLIILCSVSIFIGIYLWNVNEKKYIQLTQHIN